MCDIFNFLLLRYSKYEQSQVICSMARSYKITYTIVTRKRKCHKNIHFDRSFFSHKETIFSANNFIHIYRYIYPCIYLDCTYTTYLANIIIINAEQTL